jgi:hypothetical protein
MARANCLPAPWSTTAKLAAATPLTPAASMSSPSMRLTPLITTTATTGMSTAAATPGRWTGQVTTTATPMTT